MKLHIYITDPIAFAKGQYQWCFEAFGEKLEYTKYSYAGTIDFDIDIDRQTIVNVAQDTLNAAEREVRAKAETELRRIEATRQELRALPHLEAVK